MDTLRRLVGQVHHGWDTDRVGLTQAAVPLTTTTTEHASGRFKGRSRSVRGFMAWSGVEATVLLTTRLAG